MGLAGSAPPPGVLQHSRCSSCLPLLRQLPPCQHAPQHRLQHRGCSTLPLVGCSCRVTAPARLGADQAGPLAEVAAALAVAAPVGLDAHSGRLGAGVLAPRSKAPEGRLQRDSRGPCGRKLRLRTGHAHCCLDGDDSLPLLLEGAALLPAAEASLDGDCCNVMLRNLLPHLQAPAGCLQHDSRCLELREALPCRPHACGCLHGRDGSACTQVLLLLTVCQPGCADDGCCRCLLRQLLAQEPAPYGCLDVLCCLVRLQQTPSLQAAPTALHPDCGCQQLLVPLPCLVAAHCRLQRDGGSTHASQPVPLHQPPPAALNQHCSSPLLLEMLLRHPAPPHALQHNCSSLLLLEVLAGVPHAHSCLQRHDLLQLVCVPAHRHHAPPRCSNGRRCMCLPGQHGAHLVAPPDSLHGDCCNPLLLVSLAGCKGAPACLDQCGCCLLLLVLLASSVAPPDGLQRDSCCRVPLQLLACQAATLQGLQHHRSLLQLQVSAST